MKKLKNLSALTLLFILSGCVKTTDYSLNKTSIDPLPVRAGLRSDSLIIAIPIINKPKPTGGIRSILDARLQINITNILEKREVIVPNGIIICGRLRW